MDNKGQKYYFFYSNRTVRSKTLITYPLTPRCRVLLEQLTGLQLVKKFPAFHGTWRFITALTSVRHQSLSWASPIQSIYPHPTSWSSIILLSTHLRLGLPSGLFHLHYSDDNMTFIKITTFYIKRMLVPCSLYIYIYIYIYIFLYEE